MSQVFSLRSGRLAVGDPAMALREFGTSFPAGTYFLGVGALRPVDAEPNQQILSLDTPGVFALDAECNTGFESWYHRVGNDCGYRLDIILKRLSEFEELTGLRVAFYWENDVAVKCREGQYTLDLSRVLPAVEGGGG